MEKMAYLGEKLAKKGLPLLIGALAISSCSSGGQKSPEPQPSPSITAPSFAYSAEAANLPLVETAVTSEEENYIDGTSIQIDLENQKQEYVYETNENPEDKDAATEPINDGPTAPLIEVSLGADGKMHYQDHTPSTFTAEEENILQTVKSSAQLLIPAFKASKLDKIVFSAYEPDQHYDIDFPEPITDGYFAGQDFTRGGDTTIRINLAADGIESTRFVEMLLAHEASHAVLGHKDPLASSDERALTPICKSLGASAQKELAYNGYEVSSLLGDMQDLSRQTFSPAFQEVRRTVENGRYLELPFDKKQSMGAAACYWQKPWSAVAEATKQNGKRWFYANEPNSEKIEEITHELASSWHDALTQTGIYYPITESNYISEDDGLGHPYDNSAELTASFLNNVVREPEEVGSNVASLSKKERRAYLDLANWTEKYLARTHANDPAFLMFIKNKFTAFRVKVQ